MENRSLFVVVHVKFGYNACFQAGEPEYVSVTATSESFEKCNACGKSLGSRSNDKAPTKSPRSLSHEGATSCASSNDEAFSLIISTSNHLEALDSIYKVPYSWLIL